MSEYITKAYACYNKNERIRERSTSGGIFYTLAKYVIEKKGGWVCGAVFDSNFVVTHIITNDLKAVERMMGSKYPQSNMKQCFADVYELLQKNEVVLFTGTPCQVYTVISYFLYAYKTCVLTATQHTDIINQIQLVCLFGSQLFSAIFLLLFKNYYLYSICIPASTVANNLLVNRIVVSKFPEIQSEGQLEHDEIADIKEIVFGMVFQKIGSVVLSSVDSIVISAFLGLTILGKYNNYYYIITALFGFMNVIVTSLVPSVGNSIQTQNIETNYKLFRTFSFIYAWITIWCSACLLSLYQPFMKLWVGESNMLDFRIVVLLVIYFIVWKLVDPAYIFRDAAGSWKEYKCIPLIAAAVNLTSNIILVQYIGLQGIVISTIVAFGLIYIPFFSYPLFKTVFKSKSKYYTYIFDQVKYLLIAALVDTATFYVCKYIPGETVTGLVLKAGICIIVPNVILIVVFFKTKDYQKTMHFCKKRFDVKISR